MRQSAKAFLWMFPIAALFFALLVPIGCESDTDQDDSIKTGYVLIGLMPAGEIASKGVEKGILYLLYNMKQDGSWYDERFLGTNLPGYWYSRYDMLSTYKAAYALALYLQLQ